MGLMAKIKTFGTVIALIAVLGIGYSLINPSGPGTSAQRDCKVDPGEPIMLRVDFAPNPLPKAGEPVVIDAYVTTSGILAKECHLERGTSPFSLTLHAHKGQTVHLSALQEDQTTTMLQCMIHHRGKAVAHDLKPRGLVTCLYTVV